MQFFICFTSTCCCVTSHFGKAENASHHVIQFDVTLRKSSQTELLVERTSALVLQPDDSGGYPEWRKHSALK